MKQTLGGNKLECEKTNGLVFPKFISPCDIFNKKTRFCVVRRQTGKSAGQASR